MRNCIPCWAVNFKTVINLHSYNHCIMTLTVITDIMQRITSEKLLWHTICQLCSFRSDSLMSCFFFFLGKLNWKWISACTFFGKEKLSAHVVQLMTGLSGAYLPVSKKLLASISLIAMEKYTLFPTVLRPLLVYKPTVLQCWRVVISKIVKRIQSSMKSRANTSTWWCIYSIYRRRLPQLFKIRTTEKPSCSKCSLVLKVLNIVEVFFLWTWITSGFLRLRHSVHFSPTVHDYYF